MVISAVTNPPESAIGCSMPGVSRQPRNPPWYILAVRPVLLPEQLPQRRLFIDKNSCKHSEPENHGPLRDPPVGEEKRLAQQNNDQRDIDRIAHAAIEAGDDEMLWWCNRRRCAESVPREPQKRTQERNKTKDDHHDAGQAR